MGEACCVLDGDELRQGLSSDLGLPREDQGEQARRVAHIAALPAGSRVVPLVALVSPYAADRERAREVHQTRGVGFLELPQFFGHDDLPPTKWTRHAGISRQEDLVDAQHIRRRFVVR